jgi:uncharacterized membrane protein (DUF4010 family)
MARLAPQPLSPASATYAILAAVASNTVSKLVLGAVVGRGAFAVEIAVVSLASLAAGAGALWLALMLFPAA